MPLINLFKVTKTLTDLLKINIENNIDLSMAGLLDVTALAPEKLDNPQNTLSLHLYHVAEDAHYRNVAGPGHHPEAVSQIPMALSLFYILTAHHHTDTTYDAETQQKLMGYALKTFHDYPMITDSTTVNGPGSSLVLHPDLRGADNTLQVILRPVSPEEAITFWNSEEKITARLAAYYEVRVVMLKPEEPKSMPGIVLNLGAFLVQTGSPHLEASRSLVRFTIPRKNGGTVQEIESWPARVTLDSSGSPPAAHNRLSLIGSNLAAGRFRSLYIKNGIWSKLPTPGPVEQTVVDLEQNPSWEVQFQEDRVDVLLNPTLTHITPDGSTMNLSLLPGIYSSFVRVITEEKMINNQLKQIAANSNEVGFAVAPRIISHDAPDPAGNIQVNLGSEFNLLDPDLPPGAIQVIVGGEVYGQTTSDPPGAEKEFFVTNAPVNLIRIRPHFGIVGTEPQAHPFRLLVNGAEAAPFWIELGP